MITEVPSSGITSPSSEGVLLQGQAATIPQVETLDAPQEAPLSIEERFRKLAFQDQNTLLTDLYREGNIAGVSRLRPDFEMQYPLSDGEKWSFDFFSRYIDDKLGVEDQGLLEAIGDRRLVTLDRERQNPGLRESDGRRPNLLGYKLARYDRYKIEIELEREQAEIVKSAA